MILFERSATDELLVLCDFGMPVLDAGVRYNCRVLCQNQEILLIRPKIAVADAGNYHKSRYFTAYRPSATNETLLLPVQFEEKFGQTEAPFGTNLLQCRYGTTFGCIIVRRGCK
jgi:NAD+ synthase (glutamine-hydrolysing)